MKRYRTPEEQEKILDMNKLKLHMKMEGYKPIDWEHGRMSLELMREYDHLLAKYGDEQEKRDLKARSNRNWLKQLVRGII